MAQESLDVLVLERRRLPRKIGRILVEFREGLYEEGSCLVVRQGAVSAVVGAAPGPGRGDVGSVVEADEGYRLAGGVGREGRSGGVGVEVESVGWDGGNHGYGAGVVVCCDDWGQYVAFGG